MGTFTTTMGLAPEQAEQVIRLAGTAPSLHNTQPWRFRLHSQAIELHVDTARRLPHTDPDDEELRLGCGAALFNLRLALQHFRIRPGVSLIPHTGEPTLLATVRSQGALNPAEEQVRLFRAITTRRTNRRPFLATPVPETHRHALLGSVEDEHSALHTVDRTQRAELLELVHRAHEVQMADEGFRTEMAHWTGRTAEALEGVPASSAGPRREDQDEWVLRDFSGGQARQRVPGKDFEDDPLTVVLCSYDKSRTDDLQAGQALQRMLLTATSLGLTASLMSQVIEVVETRERLRQLLGGRLHPQALLRIGYGSPVPATPRRAPHELLDPGP
ncbi:nitroreductase family protein [Halopolyspora algeriensis]|uniref:Nitroreductase family protein n=1 Tax=Halopolyspora algeriensis TaxID=1500506 RepID=A0A368VG56_9ACTN|nr:nitroreductase family protein [Halopolyspora algeriensis]RCW39633.1 nitroreductase family protein [Halopolyspora algeriensis]TQM54074.1 nitroreductase family protein [Halopolyspora algeriensis]